MHLVAGTYERYLQVGNLRRTEQLDPRPVIEQDGYDVASLTSCIFLVEDFLARDAQFFATFVVGQVVEVLYVLYCERTPEPDTFKLDVGVGQGVRLDAFYYALQSVEDAQLVVVLCVHHLGAYRERTEPPCIEDLVHRVALTGQVGKQASVQLFLS